MPPASSPKSPSASPGTDALLYALIGAGLLLIAFGSIAWALGNATNLFFGQGPWAVYQPVTAALHPQRLWPGLGPVTLLLGARVLPAAVTLGLAAVGLRIYLKVRKKSNGLATSRDLAVLLPKEITTKARSLRPSLASAKPGTIRPEDTGILLGTLGEKGPEVRTSWEDVAVAIMAPRSGKTTSLAVPSILSAPGPAMITSNKAAKDAFTVTVEARAEVGRVWVMDPQQIAHTEQAMWWDPLADANDLPGARRLAQHFVTAAVDEGEQGDFWSTAAANTLTALFLAAGADGRPITDVLAWLAQPADRTPIDILKSNQLSAIAAQLQGTVSGAVETRDGIYETARQYASCLLDPKIAAWVTPNSELPEFKPADFVTRTDTLYLLSKDGGGSASALIAAAADSVMRTAVVQAERDGGRLDPPLLCILDEAANVCKIGDLPDLYSHLGSRGVIPITILQSYRQGQRVWGEVGMDALWSAATIKLVGSGIDDADFADKLSRLVGEHDVETVSRSTSESGRSTSVSMRQERILPADQIRALAKGTGLLFATGIKPALLHLRPWYKERGADVIGKASARQTAAITERARAKAVAE
ncbi:TraM recognition domain-containing protein [Kitasatospora purpeofusca]|uniref:TraM recognition domain-containing protein n=1 Tax=Kitasatospora purpeofusca TaxID=67352 RepID=UPI002254E5A8|nr:TraM recognition domain-containing protein [Kitasatospora purpeofusca]MCX4758779.1 TraM recognition domain-containing protein [Kitasatospora purpeofusca]WSR37108.1 TraM recognition domain-containing protein [Kitasatospora purpeofusca]